MTVFAGTGHRPPKLGGYGPDAENARVDFAIWALKKHKPESIITGMALGWDMALAEAALLSDIPYAAYIPFEGQEKTWPAKSQTLYRNLLARAERINVVSKGGFTPVAMALRNGAMVEDADTMLALWDGERDGGTAQCIGQARAHKRPIINLWDTWKTTYGKPFYAGV